MKKVIAIVEKGNDGMYSVYTEGLDKIALNGQGSTIQEAISVMMGALNEIRELYKEEGSVAASEISDIEFEYKYDVASLFDFFDEINISSFARKNGLNESLLRKYKNRLAFASEKQCLRIQQALNQLGHSLSTVRML